MEKEKKNKEEKCPLCNVSDETLSSLKEHGEKKDSFTKPEKKKGIFKRIFGK